MGESGEGARNAPDGYKSAMAGRRWNGTLLRRVSGMLTVEPSTKKTRQPHQRSIRPATYCTGASATGRCSSANHASGCREQACDHAPQSPESGRVRAGSLVARQTRSGLGRGVLAGSVDAENLTQEGHGGDLRRPETWPPAITRGGSTDRVRRRCDQRNRRRPRLMFETRRSICHTGHR